ncbi:hypothetical protein STEG23_019928, partial [Scotinomys teguina]
MKRTDSESICHYALPPPPCWAHHAPRQASWQPPSRERRPPERAGSWAVAAEEEEAASAAPWMRNLESVALGHASGLIRAWGESSLLVLK